MESPTVQLLFGIFVWTSFLSLVVAVIQYLAERSPYQKTLILYWLGIIFSSLSNILFVNNDFPVAFGATFGAFVGHVFLGLFFVAICESKISLVPVFVSFGIGFLVSYLMYRMGFEFPVYCFVMVVGATVGFFYFILNGVTNKRKPFTTVQKMFIVIYILMALNYLDWPFFRMRPHLFFYGLWLALGFCQTVAILVPMMANEAILTKRNEELEEEVRKKALQLAEGERRTWEMNKLVSLGRMAGGICHEISNPLQVIDMQIENLRLDAENGPVPSAEIESASQKIKRMVSRISEVTSNLLHIARYQKSSLGQQANDLRKIIERLVVFRQEEFRRREVRFHMELPDHELPVIVNADEISHALMNLLDNALDAVETLVRKEIWLRSYEIGDQFRIEVEDSGKIDASLVSKMMEPFFSTKPIGKGVGLGLSVAKSIVENNHGKLYLDESAEHTKFILEFPRQIT